MGDQNGSTTHNERDRKLTEQSPASMEEYGTKAYVIVDQHFKERLEDLPSSQSECADHYEQTSRVARIYSRSMPCQCGAGQQPENPMVSELQAERDVMRASEMPAEMHTHGNSEGPAEPKENRASTDLIHDAKVEVATIDWSFGQLLKGFKGTFNHFALHPRVASDLCTAVAL